MGDQISFAKFLSEMEIDAKSMGISGSNTWGYVSTIFLTIFCGDIP